MKRLIVIRPQPGCDKTVDAARRMGLEALAFPLFSVDPLPWQAPDPSAFDALLIGSANVFRHGGVRLAALRHLPAYCVGYTTAQAAQATGLPVIATGSGGLQDLLDRLAPNHRHLLRLAGDDRVALHVPKGVTMEERVVYQVQQKPMPPQLMATLASSSVVLLHSAEAARHFAAECGRLAVDRHLIALACIGPRVAAAAGSGWADIQTASTPNDADLLALAKDMCQE